VSVSGYGDIDYARVLLRYGFVIQSKLREGAGSEVFEQDIGPFDEPLQYTAAALRFYVQGDRPLVPVDGKEVSALSLFERRAERAGIITFAGALDLDDIGPMSPSSMEQ